MPPQVTGGRAAVVTVRARTAAATRSGVTATTPGAHNQRPAEVGDLLRGCVGRRRTGRPATTYISEG